ncbi:hypothetical protein K1719_018989 [Acacia pycnantha]|nr:hypothetical protein K1719_018989 [Acacia pycnantha]
MLFEGVVFFAGALINGLAQAVWMLILGRILLGVSIGFANQKYLSLNKQFQDLQGRALEFKPFEISGRSLQPMRPQGRQL